MADTSAEVRGLLLRDRARVFATAAHAAVGQVRKYTGEPYIEHPREVAGLVAMATGDDPELVAAAWLHDVVEDTQVSLADVEREFGATVRHLVAGLTDVSRPEDGNRTARKGIDREHTAAQSPGCKTVKLADLISNTRSIVQHDPEFARVYVREKLLLLEVLGDGHPILLAQARDQVQQAARFLGILSD